MENGDSQMAYLAERLDALRRGRISCESFRMEHDELFAQLDLEAVFVNLQHYLADEDIRQRDSVYRQMQESELDRLIALLQSAAAHRAEQPEARPREGMSTGTPIEVKRRSPR
jgi:hypothetical protein